MIRSALYTGSVMHKRVKPLRHLLRYKVFMLNLDLSELDQLDKSCGHWFGCNRKAKLGFYDKDHGPRDGSPLLPWVRQILSDADITIPNLRVEILCLPRILDYVFNPLSIYFCYADSDVLRAVIYEVKNTFGDQHCYLFPLEPQAAASHQHHCDKNMYVSPFIQMQAHYHFSLKVPKDNFSLTIRETDGIEDILFATWVGERLAWSEVNLKHCFWRYPLLTLKVIVGIHWEAIQIFLKKSKFYQRPVPPQQSVTIIRN